MHVARRCAIAFVVACFVGTGLLSAVFSLPMEPIRESAYASLDTLEREGEYPFILSKTNGKLDNYSDARMLNISSFEGQPGFLGAMKSQEGRAAYSGDARATMDQNLRASLENAEGMCGSSYARYWNGYTVVLKPLLFIGLDLEAIRLVNLVCQVILICVLLVALVRSRMTSVLVAFLFCLLSMHAYIMPLSLMYSIDFYIMLGGMVCVALWPRWLRSDSGALVFFFVIGMLTSYFDLLIYPIVTLGFPLAFYLFRREWQLETEAMAPLAFTLVSIVLWGLGYGAFWAAKWIIASLFAGIDALGEASAVIQTRTSTSAFGEDFTYVQLVDALLQHFVNPYFAAIAVMAFLGFLAVAIYRFVVYGKGISAKNTMLFSAAYLAVALLPFAWTLFASNHAFIHNWFTYRNFAVTLFALLLLIAKVPLVNGRRYRPIASKKETVDTGAVVA